MNHITSIGWLHRSYDYSPGLPHHAYGGGSAITHMVLWSVIHGLIYSVIFRVLGHLSLGEIVLIAVIAIGLLYVWNRERGVRRW